MAADHQTFLAHVLRSRTGTPRRSHVRACALTLSSAESPSLLRSPHWPHITAAIQVRLDLLASLFALLMSHRMEELAVTLGRVTSSRRLADIHVSDSPSLSHLHAQIEFRVSHNQYVLTNFSSNGTKVKTPESEEWTDV